jgi:predicted nucleic acid-binding protein
VISSYIFLEVVTVLSQRMGKEIAILAGKRLLDEENFLFVQGNQQIEKASWEIFKTVINKNMSFVDCTILALMNREKIPYLLTFDHTDFAHDKKQSKIKMYQ